MTKTDCNLKKSKKSEKSKNIQNSGPNHGANECPKGEPVAVGDLKASCKQNLISLARKFKYFELAYCNELIIADLSIITWPH